MNVITSVFPEEITVEKDVVDLVIQAAKTVSELYEVTAQEVSITLTDNEYIRTLNKRWRNIDLPTDVLSFAFGESDEPQITGNAPNSLGEIVISVERAKEQAQAYGHTFKREVSFLAVHGMLHLLGYDHVNDLDRREMEKEQRFVMEKLGIDRSDDGEE